MGWEGDGIIIQPGVWMLKAGGQHIGVIASWWGPPAEARFVNMWRVHDMPLPASVKVQWTDQLGEITGADLPARRDDFQDIWDEYKVKYNFVAANPVAREWTGYMKEGTGFAVGGGSSTTFMGSTGSSPPRSSAGQI